MALWQVKWGNNTLVDSTNGTFEPFTPTPFNRQYVQKKFPLGNYGVVFDMGRGMVEHKLTFCVEIAKTSVGSKQQFYEGLTANAQSLTLQVPDNPNINNCILTDIKLAEKKREKRSGSFDGYTLKYDCTFLQTKP